MRSKWVVFISRKWHTPFQASSIGWIFNLVSILLTLGLCLSLDEFILILALDVLRDCTMPSFQKCLEYEYQQDSGNHRFSFFPFFPFLTCLPALWITVEFSSLPNFILFFLYHRTLYHNPLLSYPQLLSVWTKVALKGLTETATMHTVLTVYYFTCNQVDIGLSFFHLSLWPQLSKCS